MYEREYATAVRTGCRFPWSHGSNLNIINLQCEVNKFPDCQSTVLLEKLTSSQLVKKFTEFY